MDFTSVWLHTAIRRGDLREVEHLLQSGTPVNAIRWHGEQSPVHEAAAAGKTDILRLLVSAGADVEVVDDRRRTPLHVAARLGHRKCVLALIEAGAQLDAQDQDGQTPLVGAIDRERDSIARALIAAGADVSIVPEKGCTALDMAAAHGSAELVSLLLDRGAEVRGITVLCAQESGNEELAAELETRWRSAIEARAASLEEELKGNTVRNRLAWCALVGPVLHWFGWQGIEGLVAIMLDSDGRVQAAIAEAGESDQVTYSHHEILRRCAATGATRAVVGHNHPGADPRPSDQDVYDCASLYEKCREEGIELLDYLVLCGSPNSWELKSAIATTRFREMVRRY